MEPGPPINNKNNNKTKILELPPASRQIPPNGPSSSSTSMCMAPLLVELGAGRAWWNLGPLCYIYTNILVRCYRGLATRFQHFPAFSSCWLSKTRVYGAQALHSAIQALYSAAQALRLCILLRKHRVLLHRHCILLHRHCVLHPPPAHSPA